MSTVLASTKGMTRERWLEVRRQGIGSSDMAAVAGVNPYQSAFHVWLDKTGQAPEREETEAMLWGRLLEDAVAREFSRRTGLKVRRRNAVLRSQRCPVMIANLDREVFGGPEPAILEVKTAGARMEEAWEDGEAPPYYVIQVQHALAVTGRRHAVLACLLMGSRRLVTVPVERDDELILDLERIAVDFWRLVETRTPPAVDGLPGTSEALERLHRATPGKTIDLPTEAEDAIRAFHEATRMSESWQRRRDEAANRLRAMLGDAEIGMLRGQTAVTWKTVTSTRLDSSALKAERPDIWSAFSKETTTRRLLVK